MDRFGKGRIRRSLLITYHRFCTVIGCKFLRPHTRPYRRPEHLETVRLRPPKSNFPGTETTICCYMETSSDYYFYLGPRCRRFKSCHLDQSRRAVCSTANYKDSFYSIHPYQFNLLDCSIQKVEKRIGGVVIFDNGIK